jgi:hypothetical protein
MINNHCYTFEERNYKNGFLDSFVDATYILTLDDSKRKDEYEEQLKKYIPTKKLYIVHNKGYKKCDKDLPENIPPYDLKDTYLNTMRHSIEHNYNNILILEDDFIFNEEIMNININEIKNIFINNKTSFYFNLGAVSHFFIPFSTSNVYRGIIAMTAHSIIYNRQICFDILNDNNIHNYLHWDNYLTTKYIKYFYKFPLCFQKFPDTENQKYWYRNLFGEEYILYLRKKYNKYIEINTNPKLGWYRINNTLFIINYIIWIFFIGVIFIFMYYIFRNIRNIDNKKYKKYKITKNTKNTKNTKYTKNKNYKIIN